MKVKVKLLSHVRLFTTLWTAAYQAPPSMGFSRQEYWSGLPLPSPKPYCYQFRICGCWMNFLLEIYFSLWWGYRLFSKLLVQIRLLQSCLGHLEECFQGSSLFVPANIYWYLHMYILYCLIKVNPVATLLVCLASQVTYVQFHAALKFIIWSRIMRFSFLHDTYFI